MLRPPPLKGFKNLKTIKEWSKLVQRLQPKKEVFLLASSQLSSMDSRLPSPPRPPPPLVSTETPPRQSNTSRGKPTAPPAPPYLRVDDDNEKNEKGQSCVSITPPPSKIRSHFSPSPLHLRDPSDHVPLRDLLLLSPSPVRRPKSRCLQMDLENVDPALAPRRRRSKTRALAADMGLMGCASPRNGRRSRQRLEKDEKEHGFLEENLGKVRRRRQSSRPAVSRKERSSSAALVHCSDPSPEISNTEDSSQSDVEGVWKLISDLVMWKDAAKSSLWFGFGSLCFLSSCFSKNFNFNIFSVVSNLCLFILAIAFCYDSFCQRCEQQQQRRHHIQLKEADILRVTRAFLPKFNALIAITQEIFSGEPSMTLKVAPVLLFTAKYGHMITLWRFSAFGFFISFTAPKLYSCYSDQMQRIATSIKSCACETWMACQHKKIAAFSAVTVFWNMFGFKTRIITAFISVVIIRYHRQLQQEEASEAVLKAEERDQPLTTTEETEKQQP